MPPLDAVSSLDQQTAAKIVEIIPALMKIVRQEMCAAPAGELDISQQRLLALVLQGFTTSAELSHLQGVSLAAISKSIESLVKKGYLRRTFRPNNKKQIILKITAKGKSRHLKCVRAAELRFRREIADLSAEQKQSILNGFSSLSELLGREKPSQRNL